MVSSCVEARARSANILGIVRCDEVVVNITRGRNQIAALAIALTAILCVVVGVLWVKWDRALVDRVKGAVCRTTRTSTRLLSAQQIRVDTCLINDLGGC